MVGFPVTLKLQFPLVPLPTSAAAEALVNLNSSLPINTGAIARLPTGVTSETVRAPFTCTFASATEIVAEAVRTIGAVVTDEPVVMVFFSQFLMRPAPEMDTEHAIDEFIAWYCSEPRLSFNKTM